MGVHRRFPKGDRKALWSRPQTRNPLQYKYTLLCLKLKQSSVKKSEQAHNFAVFVHINRFGGGNLRQPRHGDNIPRERHHKACARVQPHLPNVQRVPHRRAQQLRIIGEGILRFRNANRAFAPAFVLQLLQLLQYAAGEFHLRRAVDARRNRLNLVLQRQGDVVGVARL